MPVKKVEPELAFVVITHDSTHVAVFHAYQDDDWNNRCEFVYSTDVLERRDYDFDIRDIEDELRRSSELSDYEWMRKYAGGMSVEQHKRMIKDAVDKGIVTFINAERMDDNEPLSLCINTELQDPLSTMIRSRRKASATP